jgi:gamma-tubulin complex component 2
VTCSTFALYTTSFTRDANKALLAAETQEGDGGAKKRSDFLVRFETNFNHWLKVRPFCLVAFEALINAFA